MPKVLITGAGKRIGKHLALLFADRGFDVAIHYNSSEEGAKKTSKEIMSKGRKSIIVGADLRISEQIEVAFNRVFDEFGIPDVLINNAGIFPHKTALNELTIELWDSVLNINCRSQMLCSKVFSKVAKKGSKIVNFASLGGLEVWEQRIHYNVSKAGVIHLTKALARELAPKISVNCVCPGSIFMPDDTSVNDNFLLPENRIPMKRWGNVKDIFDAVYFFSTCSEFITGQILCVDGGYHNLR
jgi:NAD(P)-dependent dehydrogenase (short-subunit alcohol dehydrogenase family)